MLGTSPALSLLSPFPALVPSHERAGLNLNLRPRWLCQDRSGHPESVLSTPLQSLLLGTNVADHGLRPHP